jgi:hypothetical protein
MIASKKTRLTTFTRAKRRTVFQQCTEFPLMFLRIGRLLRVAQLWLGHLPSVNHTSAGFAHAESMRRHQPEPDHTITSRGAAAGPDRSSTGNEEGTIVIAHRVGTIARAGKRSAEDKRITGRVHRPPHRQPGRMAARSRASQRLMLDTAGCTRQSACAVLDTD